MFDDSKPVEQPVVTCGKCGAQYAPWDEMRHIVDAHADIKLVPTEDGYVTVTRTSDVPWPSAEELVDMAFAVANGAR